MLHSSDTGPMTAKQVSAKWSVKDLDEVRESDEDRIARQLLIMEKHGAVERERGRGKRTFDVKHDVWYPLELAEDVNERSRMWRRIDREWKRVRTETK
jgi:hypothetical protein